MLSITRFGAALLLISAALPFAAAGPHKPRSNDCKSNEFWYEDKSCCLPYGGPSEPSMPPSGKQCPPTYWSWHTKHEACVPHYPRPRNPPPPQCNPGWGWMDTLSCCQQPSHSEPPSPKPSGHHGWKREAPATLAAPLCPSSLDACPIAGPNGLTGDYECLDTANELESCGGCASTGAGQDCSAIEGAWNVGCERGSCAVYTCAAGFKRSQDGKSCLAL